MITEKDMAAVRMVREAVEAVFGAATAIGPDSEEAAYCARRLADDVEQRLYALAAMAKATAETRERR